MIKAVHVQGERIMRMHWNNVDTTFFSFHVSVISMLIRCWMVDNKPTFTTFQLILVLVLDKQLLLTSFQSFMKRHENL